MPGSPGTVGPRPRRERLDLGEWRARSVSRKGIVEVPRETGANAPRATWRLNGTLRITTTESAKRG